MAVIVKSSQFNAASLQADDLYIRILPPPGYIQGPPSDIAATLGTASWGYKNTPMLTGSPADIQKFFGGMVAGVSNTDPYDLCWEANIAYMQAQSPASFQLWCVRVTDGTDVAATITLNDTSAVSGLVLTALCTGILGNLIQVGLTPGVIAHTWTVTITGFDGSSPEVYTNIAGVAGASTASPFWVNLQTAINNGQGSNRPPSALLVASGASVVAFNPTIISSPYSLASGTDGRGVTSSEMIGTDGTYTKTGMYSLRGTNPGPNVFWIAGLVDTTVYATIQAFVDQEGMVGVLNIPTGQSSTTAATTKQGLGIDDPNIIFAKDFVQVYDPVNGITRYAPPAPFIAGAIACLSPEQSPSNKPVYGVVGTERSPLNQGSAPYSEEEIGFLESHGIMFITNPCPGGSFWGMRHGRNSSSNAVESPVEYARMINFLANSLQNYLGIFVGQLQGQSALDPTRAAVKATIDGYLQQLEDQNQIDSYSTVCDLTNNSSQSIAQHYLFVNLKVTFLSSIYFFVVSLQGGTTVVTLVNVINNVQLAA